LKLRELHVALDVAVRNAYGWADLELDHGFYPVRGQGIRYTFPPEISDEVLDRLLELNKARYDSGVANGTGGGQTAEASPAEYEEEPGDVEESETLF
jgi:hypothetical protein